MRKLLLIIPLLLAAAPLPSSQKEAEALVKLLASEDFDVREKASTSLIKMHGRFDVSLALLKGASSPDLEVKIRCQRLLKVCRPWENEIIGKWAYKCQTNGGTGVGTIEFFDDGSLKETEAGTVGTITYLGTWELSGKTLRVRQYRRGEKLWFSWHIKLDPPDAKGWRHGRGEITIPDGDVKDLKFSIKRFSDPDGW